MPSRRRTPAEKGSARLALTLLGATVPLLAAWAFTAGSGDLAAQAVAASSDAIATSTGQAGGTPAATLDIRDEAARTRARTQPGVTPRTAKAAKKRRTRAAAQRDLLAHPLVGQKLAAVTKRLGKPSTQRSEAAAGVIFLEYHLPNERYQLLASGGRVVEVIRYR